MLLREVRDDVSVCAVPVEHGDDAHAPVAVHEEVVLVRNLLAPFRAMEGEAFALQVLCAFAVATHDRRLFLQDTRVSEVRRSACAASYREERLRLGLQGAADVHECAPLLEGCGA